MSARYIVFACALLLSGCAVNHAPGRSSITAPTSDAQVCAVQSWPRPLPQVTGLGLTQAADGALTCFDGLRALAPDGHDVMTDHGRAASAAWTINAMNPSPYASRLKRLTPSDTTAFHPCDWASDKAAAMLGASAVTVSPTGDQAGSVDQACDYKSGSGVVTTELKSPRSFAVDAQSKFNEMTASGQGGRRRVSASTAKRTSDTSTSTGGPSGSA
jgi:hypothetical protein